ncbi:hypothetical protein [Mesorhizobium sp. M0848]
MEPKVYINDLIKNLLSLVSLDLRHRGDEPGAGSTEKIADQHPA